MGQSSVMMHITLVRFLRTQGFDHLKALPLPSLLLLIPQIL